MTLLEVKKTPDGRILARRKDRLPLTAADREEAAREWQRLVEHVAVRILEREGLPAVAGAAHDEQPRRTRHRLPGTRRRGEKLRLRDEQRRIGTAGEPLGCRFATAAGGEREDPRERWQTMARGHAHGADSVGAL